MSVIFLLLSLLVGAAGLGFLVAGLRRFSLAGRILARPTTTVARLAEGGVELAGRLSSPEPIESASGLRGVLVKTTVHGQNGVDGRGQESASRGSRSVVRKAPARLTDATGSCRLDLEESEMQGPLYTSSVIPVSTLEALLWARELIPPGSTHVWIEETIIADGATVLVSGRAEPEKGPPESYRDASPGWVVGGAPDELLVVAEGSERRLLARTLLVPGLVVLLGLGMTAMAASFLRAIVLL